MERPGARRVVSDCLRGTARFVCMDWEGLSVWIGAGQQGLSVWIGPVQQGLSVGIGRVCLPGRAGLESLNGPGRTGLSARLGKAWIRSACLRGLDRFVCRGGSGWASLEGQGMVPLGLSAWFGMTGLGLSARSGWVGYGLSAWIGLARIVLFFVKTSFRYVTEGR